jgi:hypothetical protein
LSTFCYIFQHNVYAKHAFRVGAGFIWIVSVWHGLYKSINEIIKGNLNNVIIESINILEKPHGGSNEPITDENETLKSLHNDDITSSVLLNIFSFLRTLLYTLSVVLKGNTANQEYFRNEIRFSTLSGNHRKVFDILYTCKKH